MRLSTRRTVPADNNATIEVAVAMGRSFSLCDNVYVVGALSYAMEMIHDGVDI
jgi:hypothetical protein